MILNDNSTQQINTLVIQLQNKITNLTNEFRKLNNNINDLNSEISDLEKRVSSNENDADNNIGDLDSKISDLEKRVSSNENEAAAMNTEISANTEAISGKADKIHTHTKSEITDFPTSLPANGGTADSANNGFNSSTTTDSTPGWGYLTSANGYSNGRSYGFANGGGIATAEKDTKSSLQVDGDLYVHEGLDKVATLNDIPTSLPANGGTADSAKNMYYQNLDLSGLDKTKFYPLVSYTWINFAEVAICSESGIGSMEYNQNRIHFDISTAGWSDTRYTLNIREYTCYENNEITIGCIGRGVNHGAWAIWLRGGIHYVCCSRDCDLTLKTSDFTFYDETYTVGTNYYGGANVNVSIIFTPQSTITEGAYSTRPITAPNIAELEQRVAALESKA